MKRICIIPARGGSKRIPRKNIRDFFGKPVIAYSIQLALDSGVFSKVFVSTDDEEIADCARRHGASVDFMRSEQASSDVATTLAVLHEVLSRFEERGEFFDELLCLYPIAPLVTTSQIQQGLNALQEAEQSVVFPVVEYGHSIWRAFKMDGDRLVRIWPEHGETRTQDLPRAFHDAGQWYWLRAVELNRIASLDELPFVPLVTPEHTVQDVDTEDDWKMLEMKHLLKMGNV